MIFLQYQTLFWSSLCRQRAEPGRNCHVLLCVQPRIKYFWLYFPNHSCIFSLFPLFLTIKLTQAPAGYDLTFGNNLITDSWALCAVLSPMSSLIGQVSSYELWSDTLLTGKYKVAILHADPTSVSKCELLVFLWITSLLLHRRIFTKH